MEATLEEEAIEAAKAHCERWSDSLCREKKANFGPADRSNLMRACLTAAALGAYVVRFGEGSGGAVYLLGLVVAPVVWVAAVALARSVRPSLRRVA